MVTLRFRSRRWGVQLWVGLLFAGTACPRLLAAPAETGAASLKIHFTAQDATGQIWGANYGDGKLYHWEKGAWTFRPTDNMGDFRPQTLVRGDDGAVWGVWQLGSSEDKKEFQLTRHFKNTTTRMARWHDPDCLSPLVLHAGTRGIWLTARGGVVFRIRGGGVEKMYVPKTEQMPPPGPDTSSTSYETTQIAEDNEGRVLLWSGPTTWNDKVLGLRGVLLYSGGAWKYLAQIPGAPDKPFTVLERRDAHHFWLAIRNSGLFELDSRTMTARRLPEPIPGAFYHVQDIRRLDGAWHVFAYSVETRYPDGDTSLRESTLWRWRETADAATGQWQRILSGLDYGTHWGTKTDRPVLATAQGWWVGAMPGGVWWFPKLTPSAAPQREGAVRLDWRYGLPADEVRSLWLQPSGGVLGTDNLAATWPDLRSLLKVKPETRPRIFTTYGMLAQDRRHHIWRVPSLRERKLVEWDGYRWTGYDLPAEYVASELYYPCADTRGHIWLMPDDREGKVAILNPFQKSWRVFASMQAALEAEQESAGAGAMPGLKIGSGNYLQPSFAAGGRIAYRSTTERLHYFDGKKWSQWAPGQIAGKRIPNEEDSWYGRPFFNKQGLLCVVIDTDTYARAGGKWQVEKDVDYPYPDPDDGKYIQAPAWAGVKDPQSTDKDREGTFWMVKDRQVYKAAFGLCVPQFRAGQRHPFLDGRPIEYVWVDPLGRPLFQTDEPWRSEFFFGELKATPETRVTVTPKSEDSFTATFGSNSKGASWYLWRLDGGVWSPQQQANRVELEDVPSGVHTIEVRAMNADLRRDPTPARATFHVTITQQQQLNKQLARLNSPDYGIREAGVRALGRQSAGALPLLRQARQKANPDAAWWMDAAIQEIERRTLGGERNVPEAPKPPSFRRERVEF